jgi:outer membrane receptor protein involved in Fe transport
VQSRCLVAAAALSALVTARTAEAQTEEVNVRGEPAGDFVARADERDSARELTDAASLVEPLPGVHVRRFGGDDSFTTLSIRGSSSNEVAIVLAGVPLTGGADPTLDLATLPLWPGAVARVHRSFAPAALGPGSLGGTLVLDPPGPTAPQSTEVWAAAGSFGEARLRAGDVRESGGGARIATAVSASRADDDFSYLDPTASSAGHDVYADRTNAGHAAVNGLVSWSLPVRWTETHAGSLTVTTLLQERRQQLPGTVLGPTPLARLESNRELASVELRGALGTGTWSVRGWGRREGLELEDARASPALGPTLADQAIVATGGSIGWRGRPAQRATLEVRADGSGERFAPGIVEGAMPPPGATRGSAGAAIDADWRALEPVTLAGSGRVDAWSGVASDGTRTGEVRPTGHLGAEAAFDTVVFAAHAGTTARPPSFVELYGDRGAFLGNPTLRPESAWTIDAGARAARRVGRARLSLEVVGFATWAQDLITFVPTGAYGRAKATNIGRARLAGVEMDGRAAAGPLELRASYTGLATEDDASCTAATGGCARPPLPGRPTRDLVADAMARAGPVVGRVGVDAVSGMVADVAGSIGVPPRVLASAGLRVEVAPRVRLALDVRNLFDVRTGTYAGALGPVREPIGDSYEYPLPGRSFLVSARFSEGP